MSETKSGVARDGPRSVQDLCDAIRRHIELTCKFGGADVERFELFREMYSLHSAPPGGRRLAAARRPLGLMRRCRAKRFWLSAAHTCAADWPRTLDELAVLTRISR
jgi:hypothetical protein